MCRCHFKNYVLNGKGIGLKIVVLFSLLIAVLAGSLAYYQLTALANDPSNTAFIDTLPIIKVENGKIVEPVYNHEVLIIPGNPNEIKIVVDTAQEDISAIAPDETLYITAKNIYARKNNQVTAYQLPQDFSKVITHDVVRSYIHHVIIFASTVFAVSIFVFSFMGFMLTFLILSAFGSLINKCLSMSAWGRLSAWPWNVMFLIYVAGSYKMQFHIGYLFLIPILISLIIAVRLKKENTVTCFADDNCQLSLTKIPSPFLIADETDAAQAASSIDEKTTASKEKAPEKTKKKAKTEKKTTLKKTTMTKKASQAKKK